MEQQQTLLEKLCQNLIDLFLCSDNLSLTREQYKQTVAAVIKEAKAEAIAEIESRLGRNVDTAQECLEWWDELGDDDLVEEWKDKEEEPDWAAQDAMQRNDYDVMMGANGKTYRIEQQPR